jgi:pyruvate,water dikinase
MPLTWSVLAPVLEAAQRRTAEALKDVMKIDPPAGQAWQMVAGQVYRRSDLAVEVNGDAAGRGGILAQVGFASRVSKTLVAAADAAEDRGQRVQRWYVRVRGTRWGQAELLQVMEEIEPFGVMALSTVEQMRLAWQASSQDVLQAQKEVWPEASPADVTDLLTPLSGYALALSRLASGTDRREDFINQYGHRGADEGELAGPRWHEEPGRLTAQLAVLRTTPGADPATRLASAEQKLLDHLRFLRRRGVEGLLQSRRRFGQLLDQADEARAFWLAATRLWILAAAQEALADQRLREASDIFFLELEEVKQLMTGEWNVTHRQQLYDLVAARRAQG